MKKNWIVLLVIALVWAGGISLGDFVFRGELTFIRIVINILSGFVFAIPVVLLMPIMTGRLLRQIAVEIPEGEKEIRQGGANHFRGMEGVGGKLVLTDRSLIFKSHRFNIQNHYDTFNLGEITDVAVSKSLGVLENSLLIRLSTNDTHRFIVEDPRDWAKEIERQRNTWVRLSSESRQ